MCIDCFEGFSEYIKYYRSIEVPAELKQIHQTNLALLLTEQSLPAISFWKYEVCEEGINEALGLLGITVDFEGKLGRRTKWQQFDVAQLMLDINKTDATMKIGNNNGGDNC